MTTNETPGGADRILNAAIHLFGEKGFAATSLRQIATEAGVSQALVVHHFGSKAALQRACDHHVAALTRASKESTFLQGANLDPLMALRQLEDNRPVLRYLARALTEGGENTAALVDEFVSDATEYMADAETAGLIKPSANPYERTVVLSLLSLGALAMHDHLKRLLNVDLLDTSAPPESLTPYLAPMIELFTQGLMTEGAYEDMMQLFNNLQPAKGSTDE